MDRPQFLLGVLAASATARAPAGAAGPVATLDELAVANHILAHENVVDGFGHVSARDPANDRQFWLARSKAPALSVIPFGDAQLGSDALRLGLVKFLSADEARHATQTQAGLVARTWDLWKRAAARP